MAHEHCTPYLARVQGSRTCKVDMELGRADLLEVKLPVKQCCSSVKERNEWKVVAGEDAKEIRESRQPFEDAIEEKRNRLSSNAFSYNKIIHLKDLPLGPYNVMAMREIDANTIWREVRNVNNNRPRWNARTLLF